MVKVPELVGFTVYYKPEKGKGAINNARKSRRKRPMKKLSQ
jgi:hypothetical protein